MYLKYVMCVLATFYANFCSKHRAIYIHTFVEVHGAMLMVATIVASMSD